MTEIRPNCTNFAVAAASVIVGRGFGARRSLSAAKAADEPHSEYREELDLMGKLVREG